MEHIALLCIFLILPVVMSLSALTDIYGYTIPNIFSLILIISFYCFALINPYFTYETILYHSLAGLLVLSITFVLFTFGVIGGGDAKILASSSLWFGFTNLNMYIFSIIIAGGIMSIFFMIWRRTKPFAFYDKSPMLKNLFFGPQSQQDKPLEKRSIPYAIAITSGFYFFLPHSIIYTQNFS